MMYRTHLSTAPPVIALAASAVLSGGCVRPAAAQPAEPRPQPTVAQAIKQAVSERNAGRFADGLRLLEPWRARKLSGPQRRRLGIALADLYFGQSQAFQEHSNFDAALRSLDAALSLDSKYRRASAAADLACIGRIYRLQGQPRRALGCFDRALRIERESAYLRLEGPTLSEIGDVYYVLGQPRTALEFYRRALAMDRRTGRRYTEGPALSNIAVMLSAMGRQIEAIRYFKEALRVELATKNWRAGAVTLGAMGTLWLAMGRPKEALQSFNDSLPLVRLAGDVAAEGALFADFGAVYARLGLPQKAIEASNRALILLRESKDAVGEATTLNNLMTLHGDQNQRALAILYGKQTVNLFQATRA